MLDGQRKVINKVLAENPPTVVGIEVLVNNAIDQTNNWKEDLVPVYESMALDLHSYKLDFYQMKKIMQYLHHQSKRELQELEEEDPAKRLLKKDYFQEEGAEQDYQ